jgi:hypothetical protein
LDKDYRPFSSSLCNFLHSPVNSSLLGPNILLSTLFFTRWLLRIKGPTSRLKVMLKQLLCSKPARVCGPVIWKQKLRKVNCVKRTTLFDYKNRKRRTEPSILVLDNYLPGLASERDCRPIYLYNGLFQ